MQNAECRSQHHASRKIQEQVAAQIRAKKLPMVDNVRDESDHEDPTRIVLELRSNRVDVEQITSENTIFLNVDVENTTPNFGPTWVRIPRSGRISSSAASRLRRTWSKPEPMPGIGRQRRRPANVRRVAIPPSPHSPP